ncbi:hypothetical protein PG991_013404 [Apiospora marii]|uniref:Rhodopsin domain-containing protein n=1 Tax=Apiospora marii TaxID=335849 RepID=A0ABR1R5W2_9PEZI
MIGGRGGETLTVMWTLSGISLIMVLLRLYTRAVIVRSVSADDYVYATAGLFLVLYTVFTHISALYGFGQNIWILSPDDAASAVFWEMMCQAAAVISMALAKISLALFLLRIVVVTWHKVAIWASIITLATISISASVVLWTQCRPVNTIWDRERVDGICDVPLTPVATTLGSWCVVVDFFLALFPWLFIWNLNMPRGEKITIAGSMSLGIFAGVAGIVRTVEIGGLDGSNFTYETVPLIIWSAVEIAVTMVCIVIPVIRPLCRRICESTRSLSSYQKHGTGSDSSQRSSSIQLRTIGGSSVDGGEYLTPSDLLKRDMKLGLRTLSVTQVVSTQGSQEEILGEEYRNSVRITDEVSVSRE